MTDNLENIIDAVRDRSRISRSGIAMGNMLRKISDPGIKQLELEGEPDERCASCAFRQGTVPAGCIQTTMDAMKAACEGTPFTCHLQIKHKIPCHGWYAARIQLKGTVIQTPWNYSYDINSEEL